MGQHDIGWEYSMHGRNTRYTKCLLVISTGRGYSKHFKGRVLYVCIKTILEKNVRVWLTLEYAITAFPLKLMKVYVA
jgi:hypothetical protein